MGPSSGAEVPSLLIERLQRGVHAVLGSLPALVRHRVPQGAVGAVEVALCHEFLSSDLTTVVPWRHDGAPFLHLVRRRTPRRWRVHEPRRAVARLGGLARLRQGDRAGQLGVAGLEVAEAQVGGHDVEPMNATIRP